MRYSADFEEHFKASQEEGFTEEETCEKLGDVKEIARNYLDIQSTRINSIVAGALENQRRVSLTKPGEKLPQTFPSSEGRQMPHRRKLPPSGSTPPSISQRRPFRLPRE